MRLPGECWLCFAVLWMGLLHGVVLAQSAAVDVPLTPWLMRVHQASRQSVYTGTFVVSAGANMASARIWHVCDGAQQLERVEPLSGTTRTIFAEIGPSHHVFPPIQSRHCRSARVVGFVSWIAQVQRFGDR